MKGWLVLGLILLIGVVGGGACMIFFDKVDPGNAGVLINYCDGTERVITNSQYIRVNPGCERLAEYPTAEYTLDMLNRGQAGNDSVPCVMKDQQSINMDTTTAWSVDPTRVAQLYRMRPNVPLTGDNSITTAVVRPEVRAGVRDACTAFGWEETYGSRRSEYEASAERAVQTRLDAVGIKVRTVSIRDMDPSTALDSLIQARLKGQQEVESAQFQQAQAERQGAADLARHAAAAQLEQQRAKDSATLQGIQSEAALTKARADAEQAKVQAAAEADKIRQTGEAEAAANQARAASMTPVLVEFERWKRWNGQLPSTVLGNDPTMRLEVPSPTR